MLTLVAAILAWIGIIIGTLLLLVLVVPIHASAGGTAGEDDFDARAHVSWGWGFFALRWSTARGAAVYLMGLRVVRLVGDASKKEKRRDRKAKKKRSRDRGKGKGKRGLSWVIEHRRALLRLVGRVLRALGFRGRLWMRVGLDDPADTVAVVQSLTLLDRVVPGLELHIEPEYLDEALEADGRVQMRVWLLGLVGVALGRLLFDRQTRALLKPVRA